MGSEVGNDFASGEFVIADAEVNREIAEGRDLIRQKILPGNAQVFVHGKLAVVTLLDVFIDAVHGAEISHVPVEPGVVIENALGDGGHDYIAAVAGIAGDSEAPGFGGLLGKSGKCETEEEEQCSRFKHGSITFGCRNSTPGVEVGCFSATTE